MNSTMCSGSGRCLRRRGWRPVRPPHAGEGRLMPKASPGTAMRDHPLCVTHIQRATYALRQGPHRRGSQGLWLEPAKAAPVPKATVTPLACAQVLCAIVAAT